MPLSTLAFRHRFWFLTWLVACLLLGGCQMRQAPVETPLVQSQQWWMDKSGQATLADVQAVTDWQPLPEWKTWGYGPEAIWVRLDLQGTDKITAQPWVVEVKPSYLDYVTLYDPVNGLEQHSGDALPPHDNELVTINLTFQIPAMASERTVYLKVRSISTRMMQVKVMPYGVAQQENRRQEWFTGFIVVSSALFAIWALAHWQYSRDRIIGAFAVKQLVATTWGFFLLGFARVSVGHWFPEGLLSDVASTCFLWLVCSTLWFLTVVMQEYNPARWAIRACYGLSTFLLVLPVLHWFGQTYLALQIGNFCIPLVMVLLIIALLSAWKKQAQDMPIPWGFMLCYLILYTLPATMQPLIHLGWIKANMITVFGTMLHTVLDGTIMFFMMQFRTRRLQAQQAQAAIALQRSQEKAEADARHSSEQRQLFAMLAHEMKTPLATLRMRMAAGPIQQENVERTINSITQIIERCVHTGQLAEQGLRPHWELVEAVSLTRDGIELCRAKERIDFSPTEDQVQLVSDQQILSIALNNLLDNAGKYSRPQSRIQVYLEKATQNGCAGWQWRVCNEVGPTGFPDATRLFEKYYRSPHAHSQSGSGLGLFLVKGLLNLLQGSIHYERQGNFAVFTLWVPIEASIG